MNLDWLISSALPPALAGLGLASSLYLFLTLKREMRRLEHRGSPAAGGQSPDWDDLRKAIAQLGSDVAAVATRLEREAVPPPPSASMNLSRRTQVLRMYRRGERPDQIASSLRIPLNEVELLLKVQQTPLG